MAVIDAYNHVWRAQPASPEGWLKEDRTPDELVAAFDRFGVDRGVVCPLGQSPDNDYVAEAVRRFPDRLIGFGEVNPRDPHAPAEVRRLAREHSFRGLKLHPQLMAYPVASHTLMDPILEVCAEERLIVFGHCFAEIWNMPMHYEELARTFPSVPFLLSHIGFVWAVEEALMVAGRNANVWVETSAVTRLDIEAALDALGPEKVVFGSDWPANDSDLCQEMVRRACRGDEGAARLVLGDNLGALLGEAGTSARPASEDPARAAGS